MNDDPDDINGSGFPAGEAAPDRARSLDRRLGATIADMPRAARPQRPIVLLDADGVLQRRRPGVARGLLRLGGPRFQPRRSTGVPI